MLSKIIKMLSDNGILLQLLALVVLAMPLQSQAQPDLTIGDITAAAGDTGVLVPVTFINNPNGDVISLQFDVQYNSVALTLSATEGPALVPPHGLASNNLSPGILRVLVTLPLLNMRPPINSGVLVQLSVDVAAGTAPGVYTLTLANVIFVDTNAIQVPPDTLTNGSITVGSPSTLTVPDVVGQDVTTATATLEAEGFVVGARIQQQNCIVPVGTVLDQNPDAGTDASPGSTVDLTVSACSGSALPGASATAVPTLSEWAMILMIALLAFIGGRRIWRS